MVLLKKTRHRLLLTNWRESVGFDFVLHEKCCIDCLSVSVKQLLQACLKNSSSVRVVSAKKRLHVAECIVCLCVCVCVCRKGTGWFIVLVGYADRLRKQLSGHGTVPLRYQIFNTHLSVPFPDTKSLQVEALCRMLIVFTSQLLCNRKQKWLLKEVHSL